MKHPDPYGAHDAFAFFLLYLILASISPI